jgi:hypothetical protein
LKIKHSILAGLLVASAFVTVASIGACQRPRATVANPVAGEQSNSDNPAPARTNQARTRPAKVTNPLDADRAFAMLKRICEIGPRVSGTSGMARQQEILVAYFTEMGGQVALQEFTVTHPKTGKDATLKNLIVTWYPDRTERVLLCAHYDTRPFPDRDPRMSNRRKPFLGANDGASGVALLAELAHHIRDLESPLGVDFVLFDAEELVYNDRRDPYFLGSEYFAKQYVSDPPDHKYRYAVLVDMVGDKQLQIFQEKHSLSWPDSRPLVRDLWATAKRLGVREFVPRSRYEVRDDHLALHNIAGIPSCDIIDFDYPRAPGSSGSYWHTTMDTPDKCSGESLAKVGWVILEWFKGLQ